ncbi:hypothetical protein ACEUZ9_004678 [Paracoccus litorisediminis]|uniref:hypothetical protein n=1 Tax=Paracoccus litorisediminis TaxID=2006130 RepID=UPI00372E01B6
MMKSFPSLLAAMLVLGLSACGGSGSGSGSDTPPPGGGGNTVSAPTSASSTAEMMAFAQDGGTVETRIPYTYWSGSEDGPLSRTTRTVSIDGRPVTVTMDSTSDGHVGAVILERNGRRIYRMNEDAPVVADAPDGLYVGRAQGTYRIDADSTEVHGVGDMTVTLDSASGKALYGTMVSAPDGSSSVEAYGDATYANGRFTHNGAEAVTRVNGAVNSRETVNVTGSVIGTRANNAVAGTMRGANASTGFVYNGNFMAGNHPK